MPDSRRRLRSLPTLLLPGILRVPTVAVINLRVPAVAVINLRVPAAASINLRVPAVAVLNLRIPAAAGVVILSAKTIPDLAGVGGDRRGLRLHLLLPLGHGEEGRRRVQSNRRLDIDVRKLRGVLTGGRGQGPGGGSGGRRRSPVLGAHGGGVGAQGEVGDEEEGGGGGLHF